ncbi:MAG: T9SS type A sorting domain-containing protein [Thermonemataceae bacterium]|nr:T9SS type A sorting domain-containing protein [Thermonemataceae bacterium]
MKKIHTFIMLFLLLSFDMFAQQTPLSNSCNELIKTTYPTISLWDWRVEDWEVYLPTNVGINTVRSPFFRENNPNTVNLVDFTPKDYEPAEGWELLQRTIGDENNRISNPSWAFYNKNTAVMRVFFLVVEQTSSTSIDPNKGAFINVEFLTESSPAYQSNMLTASATPLLPLEQFRNKTNLVGTNRFEVQAGFWLYADFPMVYDPCTCLYSGRIFVSVTANQSESINMNINSVPASSPIKNGNTGGDLRSNFTKFGTVVEGGVKTLSSVVEATQDLNKRWESAGLPSPNIDISDFEKFLSGAKKLAEVIPGISGLTNTVFTALDFFTGKSKKNGIGPNSVMVMNNFKAEGTISSKLPATSFRLAIPGSNTDVFTGNVVPAYNNPLGIFNLLTAPKIRQSTFKTPFFGSSISTVSSACPDFPTGDVSLSVITHTFELKSDIEFVINPALNVNYQLSDIRAAFIFEEIDIVGNETNLQADLTMLGAYQGSRPNDYQTMASYNIFRSSYYPIGCLKSAKPYIRSYEMRSQITPAFVCRPNVPKVYIKIIARLVKNNSGDPKDEILFVAKYPVDLEKVDASNGNLPSSIENTPEIITIPDGQVYNQTTTIRALNMVSIGRVILNNGARLIVRAGQIQLRETATITSQYDLQTVNLLPSNCDIKQPPTAAARIDQFCRSDLYTNPNRFQIATKEVKATKNEDKKNDFQAHPNPAKSEVIISYVLDEDTKVLVYVSTIMGERIQNLVDKEQNKGLQEVVFNTQHLPAGVYLYTIETLKYKVTKRLVVIN